MDLPCPSVILSLHASVILSPFRWTFSSHFSQELWGLEHWNLVHTWTVDICIVYTGIRLLLLIRPFFLHFSFSTIFKHWNFSSHFSQEMRGPEGWNLVHTWTVGRCIVCTGIRLLLHILPFISSFFLLSNFLTLKFFVTLFSGTLRPRRLKLGTRCWQWADVSCIPESGCCCLFVPLFFFFLSL